jgi:hypothetical protein
VAAKITKISFKAGIEFSGSVQEFERLASSLAEAKARIDYGKIGPPHLAGCWVIDLRELVGSDVLTRLAEGATRLRVPTDIAGGIRDAHVHIGDEVALLDRGAFKKLVSQVAGEVAGRLAETADYTQTVQAIDALGSVEAP